MVTSREIEKRGPAQLEVHTEKAKEIIKTVLDKLDP
jgi:hypothetical protein